jgi:hypothetical protein
MVGSLEQVSAEQHPVDPGDLPLMRLPLNPLARDM